MEQQIREINKVAVPPTPPRPKHQNPKLQQQFDNNRSSTGLDFGGWNLTDDDMEIVADVLKTNTVRSHYVLLNIYIPLVL